MIMLKSLTKSRGLVATLAFALGAALFVTMPLAANASFTGSFSAPDAYPMPGEVYTYSFTYTNDSGVDFMAYDIDVTIPSDSGWQFVNYSNPGSANAIKLTGGALNNGQGAVHSFQVQVDNRADPEGSPHVLGAPREKTCNPSPFFQILTWRQ